jgi:hypothetical protein
MLRYFKNISIFKLDLGSLKFYEDSGIQPQEFHIYDGEKVYEIEATDDDIKKDPGLYLTEILQMLEDDGVEDSNTEDVKVKNVSYSNMPENMERPNMKLNPNNPSEKEKYINDIINRRRLIEKIN